MAMQIDLGNACVVCLHEGSDCNSIFDCDENQISIQEKIIKCFPSYEESKSQYPEKICSTCLDDLYVAYRFHNNCEQTSNLLLSLGVLDDEIDEIKKDDCFEDAKSDNETIEDNQNNTSFEDLPRFEQTDYEITIENAFPVVETTPSSNDNSNLHLDGVNSPLKRFKSKFPKASRSGSNCYIKQKLNTQKNTPKICELCGNTYKYQHALKAHMRRHLNDRPIKCELCEKKFVSNVELRRHMRVHTGQKPYACSFCERCFSDYGSRIKHERTHTGERPFVCGTCNKSFAYAHVLSVHLRTHTGEKKFNCTDCGRGFTKKAYLLTHLQQHHHQTNESQGTSSQQEDKLTHRSNVKSLKCSKCGLVFSKKSSMSLHEALCNQNATMTVVKDEIGTGDYMEDCITSYIIEENF